MYTTLGAGGRSAVFTTFTILAKTTVAIGAMVTFFANQAFTAEYTQITVTVIAMVAKFAFFTATAKIAKLTATF